MVKGTADADAQAGFLNLSISDILARSFLVVGTVLHTAGCLAASLASPLAAETLPTPAETTTMSPEITERSLGGSCPHLKITAQTGKVCIGWCTLSFLENSQSATSPSRASAPSLLSSSSWTHMTEVFDLCIMSRVSPVLFSVYLFF